MRVEHAEVGNVLAGGRVEQEKIGARSWKNVSFFMVLRGVPKGLVETIFRMKEISDDTRVNRKQMEKRSDCVEFSLIGCRYKRGRVGNLA